MKEKTIYRLVIALSFAEREIHNPGACAHINVDIAKMIEAVLKEADPRKIALSEVRKQFVAEHPVHN